LEGRTDVLDILNIAYSKRSEESRKNSPKLLSTLLGAIPWTSILVTGKQHGGILESKTLFLPRNDFLPLEMHLKGWH
jgi:hypothetical protein